MKSLSICIATLNRAHVIGQTLASIIPQLNDQVELLVVDGASSDRTREVVLDSIKGHEKNARYIRLDRAGGVDHDYAQAVANAAGVYCWLMTDDDLFLPGAVAAIASRLESRPDLVIVNSEIADDDAQRVLRRRMLPLQADRVIKGRQNEQLLAIAGNHLSFIGSVVIRKDLWLSRDAKRYFGTEFVHVGVIFQEELENDAIVLAEPLLRIRYGVASWASRSFEIWMFKWPDLIWSIKGCSDKAKEAVCARFPWKNLRRLAGFKARGDYTLDVYRKYLAARPMSAWRRAVARAIAAFPDRLYNRLVLFVLTLIRADPLQIFEVECSRFGWRGERRAAGR